MYLIFNNSKNIQGHTTTKRQQQQQSSLRCSHTGPSRSSRRGGGGRSSIGSSSSSTSTSTCNSREIAKVASSSSSQRDGVVVVMNLVLIIVIVAVLGVVAAPAAGAQQQPQQRGRGGDGGGGGAAAAGGGSGRGLKDMVGTCGTIVIKTNIEIERCNNWSCCSLISWSASPGDQPETKEEPKNKKKYQFSRSIVISFLIVGLYRNRTHWLVLMPLERTIVLRELPRRPRQVQSSHFLVSLQFVPGSHMKSSSSWCNRWSTWLGRISLWNKSRCDARQAGGLETHAWSFVAMLIAKGAVSYPTGF